MTLLGMLNRSGASQHLLYLIGVPGAGKTSLVRAALQGVALQESDRPFGHAQTRPGCIILGKDRGVFSGTDALSMSVSPLVIKAFKELPWKSVFGEGDRLASTAFFSQVQKLGWGLRVVWLDTPLALADERRRKRGTQQNETWVKGRISKVAHIADSFASVRLDGTKSPGELAAELRREAVMQAITGAVV